MLHENDSLNMKSNYTFAGNTPRMETERLLLREVRQNDVRDIFGCWMNDEDVSRYMCWKADSDIDEIPYECSGGDIITEGILCRFVKES